MDHPDVILSRMTMRKRRTAGAVASGLHKGHKPRSMVKYGEGCSYSGPDHRQIIDASPLLPDGWDAPMREDDREEALAYRDTHDLAGIRRKGAERQNAVTGAPEPCEGRPMPAKPALSRRKVVNPEPSPTGRTRLVREVIEDTEDGAAMRDRARAALVGTDPARVAAITDALAARAADDIRTARLVYIPATGKTLPWTVKTLARVTAHNARLRPAPTRYYQ